MKRIVALLLSVLLTFTVCFGAFADTQYTLSVKIGDGLALPSSISDLCDAVKFVATEGDGFVKLAVNISDVEATSLAIGTDITGICVASDILSDKPMYFRYLDMLGMVLKYFKSSFNNTNKTDKTNNTVKKASKSLPPFDFVKLFKTVMTDFDLFSFVMDLTSVAGSDEGNFQLENFDPATCRTTINLDSKDLSNLLNSDTFLMLVEYFTQNSKTDYLKKIREFDKSLKKGDNAFKMNLQIYYNENGFVAIDVTESLTIAGEKTENKSTLGLVTEENQKSYLLKEKFQQGEKTSIEIEGSLVIAQEEGGELYTFAFTGTQGTDKLTLSGDCSSKEIDNVKTDRLNMLIADASTSIQAAYENATLDDETNSGALSVLVDGIQLTAAFGSGAKADNGIENKLDIYFRLGASAIVPPAASDRPAASLVLTKTELSESVSNPLADLNYSDCMELLRMSEKEISEWANSISGRATTKLFYILSLLPESALNLLSSGF